jgi:glycerophosphoryl diester phosphodiesterase
MFAFRQAVKAGADMLELDVGVTRDDKVIVMHDTTVDGKTNGGGTVASKTLGQIRKLDAAYWFSRRGSHHYEHGRPRSAYPFRGVATGARKPPKGFSASDFRVPTLTEVMRAFPRTPINVEIKGRTPDEADAEYVRNAEVLARLLGKTKRRDLIVASFRQQALDRFHALVPRINDVAPRGAREGPSHEAPADGLPQLAAAAAPHDHAFDFPRLVGAKGRTHG